jgi:UDPglucose 6-dehydrogenase
LREGQAIKDFMHPDRIIVGVESERAKALLTKLYKPLKAQLIVTDIKSAEIIKHASNSFLATKISFINAVSSVCEKVGADVVEVAKGMGLDKRIGRNFLDAGIGYGGSCFPKDLDAFVTISKKAGYDFELLKAVRNINEQQRALFVHKIEKALWILKDKTIGMLGLAFKPGTDDIRMAPSLEIIRALQAEGARVKAYDPKAMGRAAEVLTNVTFCRDIYEVARESDCLCIITEWDEFKKIDLVRIKKLLRQPVVFDGRNMFDPQTMRKEGFRYFGIGRR